MGKKIIINVPNFTYQRLLKQKETDGFGKKPWKDWMIAKAAPSLEVTDAEGIRQSTRNGLRQMWGRNMGFNISYTRRKDMKSLRDIIPPANKKCLVVGGGPSIEMHHHLETLAAADRTGLTIVSCDKMLIPLLSHGIVPDYVVSVDGSPIIMNFFDHKLVKENLSKMKIFLHIATYPGITRWLYRNKAQVYWFLAHSVFVNDAEVENSDAIVTISMTSTPQHPKGIQTMVAAGNVGVCAWAMSVVIFKQANIGLIGYDMGYPEGTPLNKTYYYSTFLDMTQLRFGDSTFASMAAQIPYERDYNPALKCWTNTDQVFRSYLAMFQDLINIVPGNAQTWNLAEGGALHHPKLKYDTLKNWLQQT